VSRVLIVGSANVDYTVALPRLPQPGETVSDGTLLVNHGGKGANQAVAARRLGAEVRMIGCVGDDAAGRDVRTALAREGIGVEGIVTTGAAATGTALISVDTKGRNQISVAPGANRTLSVEQVQARAEDFAWAQVIVCQLETPLPTVRWVLEEARRRSVVTLVNPAPVPATPIDFFALVDYLTPNAGEAARLSGAAANDAALAGERLAARGVATVVVTLGETGALAWREGRVTRAPGFKVDVVDTTAAGDAFNGALAVAMAEGRALEDGLRFANAAGALACTRRGAQPSLPSRADVDHLLGGRSPLRGSRGATKTPRS
jgi:ribokinase